MVQSVFKFDPARLRVPEPQDLDNTERVLLRDLLAPGLPLWKIVRQCVDYRDGLKESLSDPEMDLENPETRRAVFKTQTAIAAINDLIQRIETMLYIEGDSE